MKNSVVGYRLMVGHRPGKSGESGSRPVEDEDFFTLIFFSNNIIKISVFSFKIIQVK